MKKIIYTISLLFITQIGQAQIDPNHVAGGESIIEAYFAPFGNALGASLNNGWYNTAKPHNLGGFDITITLNTVLIGKDPRTISEEEIGLDGETWGLEGDVLSTFLNDEGIVTNQACPHFQTKFLEVCQIYFFWFDAKSMDLHE